MISPTPGRIVWFRPNGAPFPGNQYNPVEPLAAMVVHVFNDGMVNLVVYDSSGVAFPVPSVILIQDEVQPPVEQYYCHWMPYQLGQAKKEQS